MFKLIKKENQISTKWSGGNTTQLFIYPEKSSYEKRNFEFRISSATVDVESSTFTKLPKINRHIMVLQGTMELHHSNHHTKQLNKFDTDSFSGDWDTTSIGKVIDFNLMTSENINGEIYASEIKKGEKLVKPKNEESRFVSLYIVKGGLFINNSNQETIVNEGDFVIFNNNHLLEITALQNSEIAIAIIK